MNRLITGCIATFHFSPTQLSRQNLLDENVADSVITISGNTVIDALYWVIDKIKAENSLEDEFKNLLNDFLLECDKWECVIRQFLEI